MFGLPRRERAPACLVSAVERQLGFVLFFTDARLSTYEQFVGIEVPANARFQSAATLSFYRKVVPFNSRQISRRVAVRNVMKIHFALSAMYLHTFTTFDVT